MLINCFCRELSCCERLSLGRTLSILHNLVASLISLLEAKYDMSLIDFVRGCCKFAGVLVDLSRIVW